MQMLTLILLCHNRPELTERAIRAVLNQESREFRLVVSDNSTNFEVKKLIEDKYPDISYVSYYPGVPVFEHFNKAIQSVNSEYFSLLHDDDIIFPSYVGEILKGFKTNNYAAVATNCKYLNYDGSDAPITSAFSTQESIEFDNYGDFLRRYLKIGGNGAAPFSSYAYATERINGLKLNPRNGRYYCDTVFLLEVLSRGDIKWIKDPLVGVTVHLSTNSEASGVRDYKAFISYIKRVYPTIVQKNEIEEYRFLRLLWVLGKKRKFPNRVILKYLMKWAPYFLLKSDFFRRKFLMLPIKFMLKIWQNRIN